MQTNEARLAVLLIASIAITGAVAYDSPAAAQAYGGTYSGVAEVSVANGNVYIVRGDSGQQVGAAINAPLVAGDYLATGSGSDAEAQFDGVSMLRLADNTQVRFVNLSPGSREVQLAAGTVVLAEEQGNSGGVQIDTPSLTVRPNQSGDTRVSVLGNGQTLVTVRSGAAKIGSANGSESLTPGSTLVANGSGIGSQYPIGFDSFDQFNISRDQAVVSSYNANPYVSPQLAGYSNFANYGQWQNVPGYGESWAPNNQSQTNFTPYQNGQWVWEPGSGYTWVDNSPTGYATSHYGSWFNDQNHGGWNWQPPANQYQNSSSSLASAWLPAAVSFFLSGNGGSSGAGLGGLLGGGSAGGLSGMFGGLSGLFGNSGNVDNSNANIGWVPLAPGEQYQPWYGQNNSYPTTSLSSVSSSGNFYNYYRNMQYSRAATMVPVSAWRSGNFKNRVSVPTQLLSRVAFIRGAIPIVPTTANLRYSSAARVTHPIVLSRTFAAPRLVARAPAVTRNAFATQQAKIRSIASVRPKVAQLAARPAPVTHAVYRPVVRPPTHVAAIKPVAPVTPRITHLLAPGARPLSTVNAHAKLAPHPATVERKVSPLTTRKPNLAHPLSLPAQRPNATVVRPRPTAPPASQPKAKTIIPAHTVAPTVKPIAKPIVHSAPAIVPVRTLAPEAKPVTPVRTAIPVAKPIAPPVRAAAPIVKPTVAPVMHTPAPAIKPPPRVAPPVVAPVKPVPPPVDKDVKKPVEPAVKPSAPG